MLSWSWAQIFFQLWFLFYFFKLWLWKTLQHYAQKNQIHNTTLANLSPNTVQNCTLKWRTTALLKWSLKKLSHIGFLLKTKMYTLYTSTKSQYEAAKTPQKFYHFSAHLFFYFLLAKRSFKNVIFFKQFFFTYLSLLQTVKIRQKYTRLKRN